MGPDLHHRAIRALLAFPFNLSLPNGVLVGLETGLLTDCSILAQEATIQVRVGFRYLFLLLAS